MIEQLKDVTTTAMNQEEQRSKQLLTKSDYLEKYTTGIFAFINALCVFLMKTSGVCKIYLELLYLVPGILLCVALIFALLAQRISKTLRFPIGSEEAKKLISQFDEENKIITHEQYNMQIINYYSRYVDALNKADNIKAVMLIIAYILIISSIISIVVIMGIIIWI